MHSRERWLELRAKAGVWAAECGAIHVVYQPDEDAVLREFATAAPRLGVACEYLSPKETTRRFPAVNPEGLLGALYSPTELAVNPPEAISRVPHYFGRNVRRATASRRRGHRDRNADRANRRRRDVARLDRVFVWFGHRLRDAVPRRIRGRGHPPVASFR